MNAKEIMEACNHAGAEQSPAIAAKRLCLACAEKAIEAAVRAEREACAKVVDMMKRGHTIDIISGQLIRDRDGPWFLKFDIAEAILARGGK